MSDEDDNFVEENLNGESDEEEAKNEIEDIPMDLKENLIKYVKINDIIRVKQKELKDLKKEKDTFTNSILKFLSKIKEKTINVGTNKITKTERNVKQGLSPDIIRKSIETCITEHSIITDKKEIEKFIDKIFEKMEEIREYKTATSLRCSMGKK